MTTRPTMLDQGRAGTIARMARLCLVPVTIGLAIVVPACGGTGDCTDMACTAGAEVIFSQALDDSATYTLDIVADGDAFSCEVNLSEDYACPKLEFFVTGREATVTNSGARLPSAGFAGLLVPGSPHELRVEIRRADQAVGSASATLEYRGVEVNGAGCGKCRLDTVTMDVTP